MFSNTAVVKSHLKLYANNIQLRFIAHFHCKDSSLDFISIPTPKKGTKLVHFYGYKKGIPILYRIAKNIRNMANLIQNRYIYKNIDNIPFLCLKLCT